MAGACCGPARNGPRLAAHSEWALLKLNRRRRGLIKESRIFGAIGNCAPLIGRWAGGRSRLYACGGIHRRPTSRISVLGRVTAADDQ